jgi:hypothetical protein
MKLDIKIPETLNDLTLLQWQKYTLIIDKDSEEDFANRKVLQIFYGIKNEHYDSLKIKDIGLMVDELSAALTEKPSLVMRFELDGIEYGFVPYLDDITFGEFVDLDKYSNVKDYHKLMSILYRPIKKTSGKTYSIEKYKGSHERLNNMPLGVALSAAAFFFDIGLQLTIDTLKFSTPPTEELIKKRDLVLNGLGILLSTRYPMATYINLNKLKT